MTMGALEQSLIASKAAVALFIERGTLEIPVPDLCAAAGISARSFHRYFSTKSQVIRPYLAAMVDDFGTELDACDERLPVAAAATFRRIVLAGGAESTLVRLLRLIRPSRDYWSVFLEAVESSEHAYADILHRRNPGWTALVAYTAAIGMVSSSRLAVIAAIDGADPATRFEEVFAQFAAGWPAGDDEAN